MDKKLFSIWQFQICFMQINTVREAPGFAVARHIYDLYNIFFDKPLVSPLHTYFKWEEPLTLSSITDLTV